MPRPRAVGTAACARGSMPRQAGCPVHAARAPRRRQERAGRSCRTCCTWRYGILLSCQCHVDKSPSCCLLACCHLAGGGPKLLHCFVVGMWAGPCESLAEKTGQGHAARRCWPATQGLQQDFWSRQPRRRGRERRVILCGRCIGQDGEQVCTASMAMNQSAGSGLPAWWG